MHDRWDSNSCKQKFPLVSDRAEKEGNLGLAGYQKCSRRESKLLKGEQIIHEFP